MDSTSWLVKSFSMTDIRSYMEQNEWSMTYLRFFLIYFFWFIKQIKLLRYFLYSNTTDLLNMFFTEKYNMLKRFKAVFAFECCIRIYRKNCKKIKTVKQLLFACEKFARGSRGPCRREYFSPQITLYRMVVKTRRVWISRSRIHLSSRTRLLE